MIVQIYYTSDLPQLHLPQVYLSEMSHDPHPSITCVFERLLTSIIFADPLKSCKKQTIADIPNLNALLMWPWELL